MATLTTTYQLNLPVPGGDEDVWGDQLNEDITLLDTWFTNTFDTPSLDPVTGHLGTVKSARLPTTLTAARTIQANSAPLLILDRTLSATSAMMQFKTTGGSFYAGYSGASIWSVGEVADQTAQADRDFWVTPASNIYWNGSANGSGSGITGLSASNISTGTLSDSRLPTTMTGKTFSSGIDFGSAVAPGGNDDNSRHIDLYGGTYGLNVTGGKLNIAAHSTADIDFVIGGTVMATVEGAGGMTSGGFRATYSSTSNPAFSKDDDPNTGLHIHEGNLGTVDIVSNGNIYFRVTGSAVTAYAPFTGSGAGLTSLPAASLTGTISYLRLPTDSNAVAWFNGVSGDVAAGAIGSDRWLLGTGSGDAAGDQVAGSSLRTPYFQVNENTNGLQVSFGGGPSGSWRCMQATTGSSDERMAGLWRRYA